MILLKTDAEIASMREAGHLVAESHQLVKQFLKPGLRTREIDTAVEELFLNRGAFPLFKGVPGTVPYPATTCISVNEEVVHGIPGDRILQSGDLVTVDTGCRLNGWCGDSAWSYPVGEVDEEKRQLLLVGQQALETAIFELDRQQSWAGVAEAMKQIVQNRGFRLVDRFVGHGIGREMHENPQVHNIVNPRVPAQDFPLSEGLVITIEPILIAGVDEVRLLEDHWTVVTADERPCVHFEHTIALTSRGPEVLTTLAHPP